MSASRRFAATIVVAVLAVFASTAPAATAAEPDIRPLMTPELQSRIQGMVDAFRDRHDLPGIAAAVVTPDATGSHPVITTFVAGRSSLPSGPTVDASTQFELGSETKIFTADLLAYLVASGRVSLDDRVQQYVPQEVHVPEWIDPSTGAITPITLRDLATHQSGLPREPPNLGEGCTGQSPCPSALPGYTQEMLWSGLQEQQNLLFRPGTDWLYSDWAYGLLGTILANLVQPVPAPDPPAFQSALAGAFLDALGMSSTMLETPGPRLAIPYALGGDGAPYATRYWDNTNALSGGGGLISDASDMATFVAAHLGYLPPDAPLGVRTMADTLRPISVITENCGGAAPTCTADDFQMGLGWQLYPAEQHQVGVPWATKNGGTAGSSSDTALAPSLRIGVTTMFNLERGTHDDEIAIPILALLVAEQNRPVTPPRGEHTPSTDPAHRRHELAEGGYAASGLVLPALGAVTLLAVGSVLLGRSRRHGSPLRGDGVRLD